MPNLISDSEPLCFIYTTGDTIYYRSNGSEEGKLPTEKVPRILQYHIQITSCGMFQRKQRVVALFGGAQNEYKYSKQPTPSCSHRTAVFTKESNRPLVSLATWRKRKHVLYYEH